MDLPAKTKQIPLKIQVNTQPEIQIEILQRLYEPLMQSMTGSPKHANKAFSAPLFRSRNVMQFMDWLVNEDKEVKLVGFHLPLIVTGKDASGHPIEEIDHDYIEKRKHVMKGELITISKELHLSLDEVRGHISNFRGWPR